jgi:signal transduction histidine kinase
MGSETPGTLERSRGRSLGLVARVLAIQAAAFVVAAVVLPLIVLPLPRPTAVLYLALALAILFIVTGALIAWRIARPLSAIIEVAESATAAEDALLPEENVSDEMGRLTRALNKMTRRLAEREQHLERSIAELEAKRVALESANEALARSDRLASVGRLAAGVAHEIGNPLQSIQGYLSLAKSEATAPGDREIYLQRVAAEVERIHTLVRDLVDYARPSAASLGPVDLRRPVEVALGLVAPDPRLRGVDVRRELDAGAPLAIGDESRLVQVFLNLFLNAADALGGHGALTISIAAVQADDVWVEASVRDEGPGIPEDDLPRVFEPFFTTKRPGQGSGLGLAISKALVEACGGSLAARSEVGRGSTFVVRLRAAPH